MDTEIFEVEDLVISDSNSQAFSSGLSTPAVQKVKYKTSFSSEEKHRLANEVKQQKAIWDLSSALHSRSDAVNIAWSIVSKNMGKPVAECKSAWASLRDSRRYRTKISSKRKSGDAEGNPLETPSMDEDVTSWEFAEDLSFLPDISKRRRTISSTSTSKNSRESVMEDNREDDCSNNSNYHINQYQSN